MFAHLCALNFSTFDGNVACRYKRCWEKWIRGVRQSNSRLAMKAEFFNGRHKVAHFLQDNAVENTNFPAFPLVSPRCFLLVPFSSDTKMMNATSANQVLLNVYISGWDRTFAW